ncbi:MAG: hypothetical protein ACE361_25910 [Aureliella sp.]
MNAACRRSCVFRLALGLILSTTPAVGFGQLESEPCPESATFSRQETPVSTPQFGYASGFFIKQANREQSASEDAAFLLKVNAWAHLRYTYFDSKAATPDKNLLEFERARLVFRGNAWTPDFQYVLQLDGDNDQATQVDLLDYYITYDLGHDRWGWRSRTFRIRAGQWKVPFNRSRELSGRELSFADRSLASVFFDINRSVGIGFLGELAPASTPLEWQIAIINGFRSSAKRPVGGLDNNLAVSGRFSSEPIGEWGEDGISDLAWHDSVAMRFGGGFAVSRIDRNGGTEASTLFGIDSGENYSGLLPAGVDEFTASLFSLDCGIRLRGLSLFTEYYFRTTTHFSGAVQPDLFDHGFNIQLGYFIVPEELELLARWSRVSGDSSTLGLEDQSADEISFGMGYYIDGRNNKIVIDATHINGAPIRDSRLNYLAGDNGWSFRTQLQFGF